MEEIEKLQEMQQLIDTIGCRMDALKEDLTCVTACVQEKRLISVEVFGRVMGVLPELNTLNEEFQKLYVAVEMEKERSDEIETIKNDIAQAVCDIKLNMRLARYKRFLFLETEDEETKKLLDSGKADLQKLLDSYSEDCETELEPYARFVDTLREEDSAKVITLILELAGTFGNALLGKAFLDKTIDLSADECAHITGRADEKVEYTESQAAAEPPMDLNGEDDADEDSETQGDVSDAVEAEMEMAAAVETEYVAEVKNVSEMQPELVLEEKPADGEAQKEVAEKGLLLTKEIFDKPIIARISDAESAKIATKIFRNEIGNFNFAANAISLRVMDTFSAVTDEIISLSSSRASSNEIEVALDYLFRKGYIREYGVYGIGLFYCLSPRFVKAVQSRDARLFIHLKGSDKYAGKSVEDGLHPVLSRLGYTKLLVRYLKKIGHNVVVSANCIGRETFACRVLNISKDRAYIFMGAFFADGGEADEFVANIKDAYFDEIENLHFVVAGIRFDYARKLADYLIEKVNFEVERLYCYSLIDDRFVKYGTNQDVEFESMFNDEDSVSETNSEGTAGSEASGQSSEISEDENAFEKPELVEIVKEFQGKDSGHTMGSIADGEDAAEKRAASMDAPNLEVKNPETEGFEVKDSGTEGFEVKDSETEGFEVKNPETEDLEAKTPEIKDIATKDIEIKDVITKKFEDKPEIKEGIASLDRDVIMRDVYQMIVDGKTYCATAYLRSMMYDDPTIKEYYEKLAYAVNDPWERCSYNSQKIFTLYSNRDDLFSKYLMAAASLRNYFMNHTSFDYDLKSLQSNIKELSVVKGNSGLTNAIYTLVSFKESNHKGVDVYAAYRARDEIAVKKALDVLSRDAATYYENYVKGQPKNHKHVKRFTVTWKLIFSKENDLPTYLQAVMDGEHSFAELCRDYLAKNFMCNGGSLEYSNIDRQKMDKFVDEYWDEAHKNGAIHFKTTPLMSDLRNYLINALNKVLKLLCDWISLVDAAGNLVEDDGSKSFIEIQKKLIEDLQSSATEAGKKTESPDLEEAAGAVVLRNTIEELLARLDGTYDEKLYKYYYIDFLKGREMLLDEEFLPDMRGKFADLEELSLSRRIWKHSKSELMSFEEKLEDIFNLYGDDYGTAERIAEYLKETGAAFDEEKYDIRKSAQQAEADARIQLDDFVENLELAQSYGQIEETRENKKEKIQKIAYEWFDYANETKNYGFFKTVLKQYRHKIGEDAKVRGNALLKELDNIKGIRGADEHMQKRIDYIREMIEVQNYTVAEDLLSRIKRDESDEEFEVNETDYLQKFIDDYDYNYKLISDSSVSVSTLASKRSYNKDDKGANRLVNNWMSNGSSLNMWKVSELLGALGFTDVNVRNQPKIGKVENYLVTLNEVKGRKVNYKHPIAAFGSKAVEEGLRVVCLFGRYDADRLIEEFKNIGGNKNTFVLLDFALPLAERRRLARKMKSELSDRVFAVLDRVLLMFLVNNYNVQFINQILMSTIMPFSYYQPYVWASSKVMPPEIFMGRKNELEKIESPDGVNIVYGGRQLGKSALLKMAKMNIDHDENNDRAVYIDIMNMDYRRAAKKISNELYDTGILDRDLDTTDWYELSRAIKQRLQEDGSRRIPYLLLLIDEADKFIDSCEVVNYQPFDALKDIQSVGGDRFKFVIAGLHNIVRFKRDAALSNNNGLPHLTSITITPFSQREARQLLEEPLRCLGFRFPKDKQSLVSLILANTNYFPGLIQLYCAKLIEAMRDPDYAGYDQADTPAYEVNPNHIKKVLSDKDFMDQIREKFEITLKLGDDNMYDIIALLMAYLYHQNANSASESNGYTAADIIEAAKEYSVRKVADQSETVIDGLMQELMELNIFRQTVNDKYLFSRYSFFQMMGTTTEVDDKLIKYMEDE